MFLQTNRDREGFCIASPVFVMVTIEEDSEASQMPRLAFFVYVCLLMHQVIMNFVLFPNMQLDVPTATANKKG